MSKYILIFLITLFFSCTKKNDETLIRYFRKTEIIELKSEVIKIKHNSTPPLGFITNITFADSLLIISDVSSSYKMKILDLRSNNIRNFGKRGRGPNEFSDHVPYNNIRTGELKKLYINDNNKHFIFHIDSLKKNIDSPISQFKIEREHHKFVENTMSYCNGGYVIGASENKRFSMYNINENTSKLVEDYKDESYLVNASKFYSHPMKSMVASVMLYHDNLSIFTLNKNNTIVMKELEWWRSSDKEVSEKINKNTTSTYVKRGLESKKCFLDLTTSSNLIYALYSGMNCYNKKGKLNVNSSFSNWIYVFDWDGKPKKRYKLNKKIFCMTIDEKNNHLYAFSIEDGIPILGKYDLN